MINSSLSCLYGLGGCSRLDLPANSAERHASIGSYEDLHVFKSEALDLEGASQFIYQRDRRRLQATSLRRYNTLASQLCVVGELFVNARAARDCQV